jgi:transcriptional regulator with XRE-family HTH domain
VDDAPHFSNKLLREARDSADLTREHLAVAADVPYGTLQRFEVGATTDPGINALARIARVLDISLDELVAP